MQINWRVRLKNPIFWGQIAMAAAMPVLAYSGLTPRDLTTWQAVLDTAKCATLNPYVLGLAAVSVFNAINDPTTKGFKDSKNALLYEKPKEDETN